MSARLLSGLAPAERLLRQTATSADVLRQSIGRAPRLAVVSTRVEGGALTYWQRIEQFAHRAAVEASLIEVDAGNLFSELERLNDDDRIDGILPLAPFPPGCEPARIAGLLNPAKDIDGLTPHSAGQLARALPGLYPCTPQAVIALAEEELGDLRGMTACVVGASIHVGRPLAELLLQRGATITVAHVDTRDLAAACSGAELLFIAVGKPGLIDARHIGKGATIIDIGINLVMNDGGNPRIVGDVDLASASGVARAISLVPDGVGPLTTAFLIHNTVLAAGGLGRQGQK